MMNPDVKRRVLEVIARVQRIAVADIPIDSDFEALGMDSFDTITLVFALEEEFDLTLPDEAKEYKRIEDVVCGIETLLNECVAAQT